MIPSASGLPRAFRCRASMLLPQVRREHSKAAHKGTQVHTFLEEVPKLGRDAALLNVTDSDAYELCAALDLERLPLGDGAEWAAEVAYVYDVDRGTAYEAGRSIGRNYGALAPSEVPGTADLVTLTDDGDTVIVLDAKTGYGWLPEAGESEQLKFLALAACRAHGASRARIGHLHLRDNGDVWTDWAELDAFDLDAFASSLRMLAATTKGEPAEGGWCAYCPAFQNCPAKAKLAASLASGAESIQNAVLSPLSARLAWERVKLARKVLDEVEAKVREYALASPVELDGGVILGPVETESDDIDDEKAAEVLRKVYGEKASIAIAPTVTKKGIERLARHRKESEGVTIKEAKGEALEQLRRHGALTVKRRTTVKEHHAK